SGAATGGSNFQSFSDFANFLNVNGICGPVIANVVPNSGPYVERVEFDEIVGSSSVNTITINGNGNTLSYAGDATNRTTLTLNGTDYLTVDSLNIVATGVSYGWVLFMTQGADHNTFKNCTMETSTASTSTFFSNVVMSGSPTSATLAGNSGSYNTFENNTHIGGYYGITMNGPSAASKNVGNKVLNSVFEDFALYGMYVRSQDSLTIDGNDLSRATRTTLSTFYGLFFTTGIEGARIMNNRIHDNSNQNMTTTNAAYPIYMSSATGTAGNPNIMANNLIYNINNGGTIYTMYLLGAANNFWKILHNTVVIDMPNSTSTSLMRNVFVSGAQNNMEIKNNIFYLDRGAGGTQYQVYFTSSAHNVDINNNNYFHPNSAVTFGYNGVNIGSFAAWQTAGLDVNGLEFNPDFVGAGPAPLRPRAAAIKFLGTNVLSDVPTDIEGFPRTPAPDPGAYQFEPPQGIDMGIVRFLSPDASCPGTANVTVEVGNFASDTAHTIYISWSINNVAQTPIVVTDSFYPGNLIPITVGTFTIAAGVSYDIEVNIDSVNPGPDIDLTNNFAEIIGYRAGLAGTFTMNQLAVPTATNFTSFADLADALNTYGVCGPVTINVLPGSGPYNEQFELDEIQGTSAANTITINGNGNTLSHSASGTADRNTITFNGTDYVTIDSLIVQANGTAFGWVMWITNNADHNTFKNCVFETDDNSTSLNFSNVVMSGSPTSGTVTGDIGNYNTFENNHHIGGYYGITMSGISTAQRNIGNKVINSTFEDFYLYGMYLRSQDSLVIDGNDLSRGGRTTLSTFYGIFLTQGHAGCQIINNRIHDNNTQNTTNTNAAYPIYLSNAQATAASPSILANNLLYNINNGGVIYALYFIGTGNNFWKVYHNTVVVDQPGSTSSSATRLNFVSGAQPNMDIVNNIFYLNRQSAPGFFSYFTQPLPATSNVDNNVYFSPNMSTVTFGFSGGNQNTFADWQSSGFDLNGLEANPTFVGGTGNDAYRPTVGAIKNAGANVLSDVPTDIEGVARTTTPDPGVFQFNPLPCSGVYGVTVDTLYPGGAALSWTSVAPVNQWEIEWDICGFTPGSAMGNLVTVTNNNGYLLDSLPMGVCVCVFIREVCPAGGFSDWSQEIEICVPIEDDAELVSIVSPEDMDCGDSLMPVMVEIRNNGFNPITSMPITVNVTGDINQTFNMTYTGNLLENEVDTVTVGTINSYWGGWISIEAFTSLPNDQLVSNDSMHADSLIILPFQPKADEAEFCPGMDSITLRAMHIPNVIYNWFDVSTGGSPIHVGDSIKVSTAGTTNYFLAYNDMMDSLESSATGNVSTGNGGSMFDLDIFNSLSVTGFSIYGASSGMTDVQIYYKVGSLQGHENNSASWTLVETIPNVMLQGAANIVKMNLSTPLFLPANQVYGIYIQPVTGNISYASGNPIGSSLGVNADLEILTGVTKSGVFGSTLSPRSWKGRVHYGSESCSDIRTPVVPTLLSDSVVAGFEFNQISHTVEFYNTSVNATQITWIFDTLATVVGGDTVHYQFPVTDSFTVCLIAESACGIDTICKTIWAENVSVTEHSLAASLRVFPNPNEGKFTLSFDQQLNSDVTIQLLDLSGKTIWTEHHSGFSGVYQKDFDRNDLSSGMYMLRINNRDGIITRRVVIGK
ncbi:MAG: T9SS type A sorting domain-containing protein, partial [Cryomorphaceae bacterium]|nr:T9SS type A sorting domain-containing protein [Cryomorphaceae bacterium]